MLLRDLLRRKLTKRRGAVLVARLGVVAEVEVELIGFNDIILVVTVHSTRNLSL